MRSRRSRRSHFARVLAALACALALAALTVQAAEPLALAELAKPGRVLMLRHAHAPGTGDPPQFKLGDCSTQRNLDATVRAQAAQLGQRLAAAGVVRAKLYSNQWCRCLETARLLKLGTPSELPALNSFLGRPQDREPNLAALRAFLAGLPPAGPPVVLVTHQLVITAFTGQARSRAVALSSSSTARARHARWARSRRNDAGDSPRYLRRVLTPGTNAGY